MKLTEQMIQNLNKELKNKGTVLHYIKLDEDATCITYTLSVSDIFIDNSYGTTVNYTNEFERFIRNYFKELGVEKTGYSNHVKILIIWKCF